jgi:hypothetical protein
MRGGDARLLLEPIEEEFGCIAFWTVTCRLRSASAGSPFRSAILDVLAARVDGMAIVDDPLLPQGVELCRQNWISINRYYLNVYCCSIQKPALGSLSRDAFNDASDRHFCTIATDSTMLASRIFHYRNLASLRDRRNWSGIGVMGG